MAEITLEQIKALIDDALAGAGEQFAAQARTAAETVITEKVTAAITEIKSSIKLPTPEEIAATVKSTTAAELASQAKAAADAKAASDLAASTKAARDKFLGEKFPKLPAKYRTGIPDTADEAQLAQAATAAMTEYAADLTAAGVKIDLGAPAGGKSETVAPALKTRAELQKMSPAERKNYALGDGQ